MTILHLIPESGHQTAALLRQQAEALYQAAQSLRRDLARLQIAWQGGRSESFQAAGQALARQLQTQAEALDLLARRLEAEIQEWETVDRRGAESLRGLFRSALAWLPQSGGGVAVWPLLATFSISSWLSGLPAWLNSWLERLFPPESIHSPIPDEPVVPKGRLAKTLRNGFARLEQKQASSSGQVIQRLRIEKPPPPAPASPSPAAKPSYGHDVPFLSQHGLEYQGKKTEYGCVPTSVSMILNYWHNQDSKYAARSPQELLDLNAGQGQFHSTGMSPSNLIEDVKQLGYSNVQPHIKASWEQLREDVKKGPVLAVVKLGMAKSGNNHSVVVTGISEDGSKVLVNDPWSGIHEYDATTFQASWGAVETPNSYVVIRP